MGQMRLNAMEFYAYHGCHAEERLRGNNFLVDIVLDVNIDKASQSDSLSDALDYVDVYEIVRQQMAITSFLLENVTTRILSALVQKFPNIERATVYITKLCPPVGGKMHSFSVSETFVLPPNQ
jgi:dihydroneopterin aldolase